MEKKKSSDNIDRLYWLMENDTKTLKKEFGEVKSLDQIKSNLKKHIAELKKKIKDYIEKK